jgi:hypothetical protein
MMRLQKYRMSVLFACLAAVLLITYPSSLAQDKTEEELKKKYAPILGEYEFVAGGGSDIIRFYIEDGALWADSGDGRPVTLEPAEDETFSFTAQDPISGEFEIIFMKDDQGEYSICHIANAAMGLELEGIKIK